MKIRRKMVSGLLGLGVALPVIGYTIFLYYSTYRIKHSVREDVKVKFYLNHNAKTPLIMPTIRKYLIAAKILDSNNKFTKEFKRTKLKGFIKLSKNGIFDYIEEELLSSRKYCISNFSLEDYYNGNITLYALRDLCEVGIKEELREGKIKEASRKIDILSIVAMEYPSGTWYSAKNALQQACVELLREKLRVMNKNVTEIKLISKNGKEKLLSKSEWEKLIDIVEASHKAINKKKWSHYVNITIKYPQKTTHIQIYDINNGKNPLKLSMIVNGSCYELTENEASSIQKLMDMVAKQPLSSDNQGVTVSNL